MLILESTRIELFLATTILIFIALTIKKTILSPQHSNLFHLILIFIGLYFGLGPWVAFVYGNGSLPYEPENLLFYTYLIVFTYILGIWLVGSFATTAWGMFPRQNVHDRNSTITGIFQQFRIIDWKLVTAIAGLVWTVRIFLGLHYGLFSSGTGSMETMMSLPYHMVIISHLAIAISIGCLVWSSAAIWSNKSLFTRLAALVILILEFSWAFASGRRWMLMWLVFIFFGFLSSGRRLRIRYLLLFIFTTGLIVNFIFPLFFSVRTVFFSKNIESRNVVEHFGKSVVLAYESRDEVLKENFRENMSERPLGAREFICRIREGLEKKPPMMGKAIVSTFLYTVPSIIYPGKRKQLETEQSIQNYFQLPMHDTANTWPATGCADFDLLGGLIAGLILGLWIILIQLWYQSIAFRHPFVSLTVLGNAMFSLMQVEASPTVFWGIVRNLVIVWLIAKFISVFTKLRTD